MAEQEMPFLPGQLEAATFKMVMENNAYLRILLANQLKIAEHFNIDLPFPYNAYTDLMPGTPVAEHDTFPSLAQLAVLISHLNHKRAWEWAQLNTSLPGEHP